jgi:hypothetical protein
MTAHRSIVARHRRCPGARLLVTAAPFALAAGAAHAQQDERVRGLEPGEGFVTRFAGTTGGERPAIDINGTVGSILDLRVPGTPARGSHWVDEPQRAAVRAAQVGQIFGVALDDATPPNIYVAATSAFGLHLDRGGAGWMRGMWGADGGPGTIYKLEAGNGYRPRPFADVRLAGRANSGPALGNLTYDRVNRQLLVSDLETGMLHRIRLADGADLGTFDHGVNGRPAFLDAATGQRSSLPAIPFDPQSRARLEDCPGGEFSRTPACWNFAPSGRRVWGVGVRQDPQSGQSRLYYAVWSGPAFGDRTWASADEADKRVAVWSIGLGEGGAFDPSGVRREFELPDFFLEPADISRAGYSHPVSDITFAECSDRPVMLLAERGGIRNLGLAAEDAFAKPHEARALRYELDQSGAWRPVGRYDVGFYERTEEGAPHIRANCAGGIAFAPGIDTETGQPKSGDADRTVWISGHALCSPKAPCNMPAMGQSVGADAPASEGEQPRPEPAVSAAGGEGFEGGPDDSHVHGVQGGDAEGFAELLPEAAQKAPSSEGDATSSASVNRTWLVDTDVNVDENGMFIEEELTSNDATRIGDIAIYQPCAPRRVGQMVPAASLLPPPPPMTPQTLIPPTYVGHGPEASHARVASHGTRASHNRFGSHNPYWSHNRWGSHSRDWSHRRDGSHDLFWSHNRWGSHGRRESHNRLRSHARAASHWQIGSHVPFWSHNRFRSHNPARSHGVRGSHNIRISHARLRSHNLVLSHTRMRSHTRALSHTRTASHAIRASHARARSHNAALSHNRIGSHMRARSHGITGSHNRVVSHGRSASHNLAESRGNVHLLTRSHRRAASGHAAIVSQRPHGTALSHTRHGSHNPARSAGATRPPQVGIIGKPGFHARAISRARPPDRVRPPRLIDRPNVRPPRLIDQPKVRPPRVIDRPKVTPPRVIDRPKVTPPRVIDRPKVKPPRVIDRPKVRPPRVIDRPKVRPPRVRDIPKLRTPRVRQVPRVRTPRAVQPPRVRTPRIRNAPRVQTPRVRTAPRVRVPRVQAPRVTRQPRVRIPGGGGGRRRN